MMKMNEPIAGIFRRRRRASASQLAVAVLTVVLLVTPLFTACDEGDGAKELPQAEGLPLSFSTTVEQTQTRAELNTDNLTTTGVFGYLTNGDFNGSNATPGFMFNQKVERINNSSPWTYSPIKYWPNNTTDRISFFAYAPYVDETVTGGSNPAFQEKTTAKGFPTLAYTVPSAEANQIDLLASVPLMNQRYEGTGGKVTFTMNHALTKATIFIKSKDDEANKKVTAFSITSAENGTFTFHAPVNADDVGFGWNDITGTRTYTPTNANINIPANTTDKVLLGTFYLLPQGAGSTFDITYTYSGTASSGSAPTRTVTLSAQPLPSLDKWVAGTSISYHFAIGKTTITVTAVTHPAWNDGGTGTVTGNVTITYAEQGGNAEWTPDTSETLDGTETDAT